MALVGDPAWRVAPDEGHLVVTAGADAVWLIEDVPAAVAEFAARFWTDSPPAADDVPSEARPVVEHLAGLGALRPTAFPAAASDVGVLWAGPPSASFAEELERALGRPVKGSPPADGTTLVVRTNAPLLALLDVAADLHRQQAPHVFCDLAFHHTIGLGPHVVPGDTACLGCLVARVGVRWGDPEPPVAPAALRDAGLAARLALRALAGEHASLVNAAVSFDLATLVSRREALWRSPACAVCSDWPASATDGRIALPWGGGR